MDDKIRNMGVTPFRIAEWTVEPALNRLTQERRRVRLQPRHMDLLCRLAREPMAVVSREDLLHDVWPRSEVNDEVLSRCIAEIRSALGDDSRQPRFIETIPRRGYRLLVEPEEAGGPRRVHMLLVAAALVGLIGVLVYGLSRSPDDVVQRNPERASLTLTSRQVTHFRGIEQFLSADAEGAQIAFLALDQEHGRRILVASGDGENARMIRQGDGLISPALSPDGKSLAFVELADGGCHIRLLHLESNEEITLTSCWADYGSSLAFSPDGAELVFSRATAKGAGLATVDLQTGTVQGLTDPGEASRTDRRPRYSPDGAWISFSRGDRVTRELFRIRREGGTIEQLTFDQQLAADHTWIGTDKIVYASDRKARQALWQLDLASGTVEALGAAGAYGPSYHPATGRLYFELARYEANLWQIRLDDPQEPTPFIQSSRYDNHPVFSPDGARLAFISNRSGLSAVWLARADGADLFNRFQVEDARVSRPAWSPDGRLLVSVYGDQGSRLMELDPAGGPPEVLDAAGNAASAGVYSDDSIYYIDERSGEPAVWRIDRATGQAAPLGLLHATRLQWGGEGRLYFTRPGQSGIYSVAADGSAEETVIAVLSPRYWNDWTVVGNALYFSDGDSVRRLDLSTGDLEPITDFIPSAIGITLGVDPAESRLLVSRTDDARIDIHVAPFH